MSRQIAKIQAWQKKVAKTSKPATKANISLESDKKDSNFIEPNQKIYKPIQKMNKPSQKIDEPS